MKKLISTVLCLLILLSCILPAMAATGVPKEVMESTKSVVRILSKYYNGAATGSGFVIKNEPGEVLIATNDHVVEGNPTSISIWVGEDRMVDAEIVFTTSEKDLCVLKVTDEVDMKPLKLSKKEPQHGAAIYVVGYPGAGDILSDTQAHTSDSVTITDGIISAIRSFTIEKGGNPVKLLQVNAAINSGNSGGPLFDTEGVVVGVNTYKVNADSQGVFGSVAISELWSLLDQYGIEIPERLEVVEAEVKEEASFLMSVLICAGAVGFILVMILIAKFRSSKTPRRKRRDLKVQAITLQTHMEKYPQGLGIGGAVSLLLPIAIQLRNLHNDGKLHLQICPENIIIGADGASLKDPSSQETGRFNSGFAAPEIYRGAGFGITSDIYSFAAVLLYATTGKVPANSLQQDALEQDFSLLDDVIFAQITRKAMASNILDRTQSMQELIYSIAVYNAPVQERQSQPLRTVETVPVSISEERPAPVKEEQTEIPKHRKKVVQRKKHRKLLPIAAVLVCGIVAVVLLWKPAVKQDGSIELQSAEQTEIAELSEEEIQYQQAEKWEADGQLGRAAIAFGKMGDFRDARERSFASWEKIIPRKTLMEQNSKIYAIKNDGTVLYQGINFPEDACSTWTDINDVCNTSLHVFGLKSDGTILPFNNNGTWELDISEWIDLVDITGGFCGYRIKISATGSRGGGDDYLIGLKADGTVIAAGDNNEGQCDVSDWTGIVAIATDGYSLDNVIPQYNVKKNTSNHYTVGLKYDGTLVVAGKPPESWDLSGWTDIVKINTSGECMAGLKSDGTVISTHYDVSDWKNITDIDVDPYHVLGLREDGTIAVIGNNNTYRHLKGVEAWSDIVQISASDRHTVGLKADGSVLAVGYNNDGRCDVSNWTDIVAIETGDLNTVALKADGTALLTGWKDDEYFDLSEFTDIKMPQKTLPARNGNETKSEEIPIDQQAQYDAAEKLLASGETAKAAIAFGKLGDYADARERSFALWNRIQRDTVSTGNYHTVGVKADGTVAAVGRNDEGQCNVEDWTDIVAISAGGEHTVGLKADGTVVAVGQNAYGQSNAVEGWENIVGVSTGTQHTVGLKVDGTIVAVGRDYEGQCNVEDWTDIIAVNAGDWHTVGLKSDGTVIAVGSNDEGQCNVEDWTDIVAISAGGEHTVGLKADGTVVAVGYDNSREGTGFYRPGQCNVEDWRNIVAVSAGYLHTVGVKADGTVVAVGQVNLGQCNVGDWTDIVAIDAGYWHTIGLKVDGTVVAFGYNGYGQCSVSKLGSIRVPAERLLARNGNETKP